MTILITGATGTIGSQVLAHLQGADTAIRVLSRSPEKATLLPGVTPVRGDLARRILGHRADGDIIRQRRQRAVRIAHADAKHPHHTIGIRDFHPRAAHG